MMTITTKTVLTAAAGLLLAAAATATTPTPTSSTEGALALGATCASPPCDLPAIPGTRGVKTIVVNTLVGTAVVLPICRNGVGNLHSDTALSSMTGANCATTPSV